MCKKLMFVLISISLIAIIFVGCSHSDNRSSSVETNMAAANASELPPFIIVNNDVWMHPTYGKMPDNMEYVGTITYISKRRQLVTIEGIDCATNIPEALGGEVYISQDKQTVAIKLKDSEVVYVASHE